MVEKIGAVAYRLTLLATAQLHGVFHDTKLKRCVGDPSTQAIQLPAIFHDHKPVFQTVAVLHTRDVLV